MASSNTKKTIEDTGKTVETPSSAQSEDPEKLFDGVEIDDEVIEQDDLNNKEARKLARKNAKKHLTPEEIKKAKKKKRILISGLAVVLIVLLSVIPPVRFAVLNFVGFRNDIIITVLDNDKKPVSNASAVIDGKSPVTTDVYGRATLQDVRFGNIPLVVTKAGYAKVDTKLRSDIRTGRAEPFTMKLIGIKIDITVKDWLSGRPITGATAESGEAKATADNGGTASLVVMPTDSDDLTVEVKAKNYLSKKLTFDHSVRTKETLLVSSSKNYFMSIRSGRHDIYSSNLDGSNVRKIIESTGKETREVLGFAIHPDNRYAVLVANREGKVQNSMILAGVYRLDLKEATIDKIDEGTNINLWGWSGDSMVYTKSKSGVRFDDKNATELRTLNVENSVSSVIASANTMNDIFVYPDMIVYYSYNPYSEDSKSNVLIGYNTSLGTRQEFAKDRKLSYLTQPQYKSLNLMLENGSTLNLSLLDGSLQGVSGNPTPSKYFHVSSDSKHLIWVERRDGKGVLLRRSIGGDEEKVIARQGGFTDPVRDIGGRYIIVRSSTTSETADYIVDIASGKTSKVNDVFDVWLGTREWR